MDGKIVIVTIGMLVVISLIVFVVFKGFNPSITSGSLVDEGAEVLIERGYVCDSNIYNCEDFENQSDAQAVLEACGGAVNDVHFLDRDNDGVACEILLYEMAKQPVIF